MQRKRNIIRTVTLYTLRPMDQISGVETPFKRLYVGIFLMTIEIVTILFNYFLQNLYIFSRQIVPTNLFLVHLTLTKTTQKNKYEQVNPL